MRVIWIAALIASLATVGISQPQSVEQALALALRHNPRVRALRLELEGARHLERSAAALHSPHAFLAPTLTTGGVGEELMFAQPLELTGARQARMRVAALQYELTYTSTLLELNDILAEVAKAYYEYAYRARIAQTAQDALAVIERMQAMITQQVEAGARAGVDLLQVGIETERVRQHAQQRELEAQIALQRLRALIGTDANEHASSHSETLPFPTMPSVGGTPLPVRLESIRLEYEGALYRQIRQEGVPDLGVQVRIERFRGERTRPGFGLTLSLPLFDYGTRRHRLSAQSKAIEAQALRLQHARLMYETELRNAEQRLAQARTRYDAYQAHLLPSAQKLAQTAQIGLEAGQLSILQLLEAQRTVRSVQEEALQAELELKLSETELKRLRGEFILQEGER